MDDDELFVQYAVRLIRFLRLTAEALEKEASSSIKRARPGTPEWTELRKQHRTTTRIKENLTGLLAELDREERKDRLRLL